MKQIVNALFLVALFTIGSITISISNPSGAPAQASGGPAEGGATCSQGGCHGGTATARANVISSDIPSTGYIAGTTYNITVTLGGTGAKGFQVSAQKTDGSSYLGTFTAGTGSRIMPTSYVTHSSSKSPSPAVWTFKWKAPVKGTGDVNFYGAFAVTKSATYTDKYTVKESASSGISESASNINLNVYPNPLQENIYLSFDMKENAIVSAKLLSVDGKSSFDIYNSNLGAGNHNLNLSKPEGLQAGIYFLQLNLDNKQVVKKVFVD
jgi:hypothetical protein